MKKPISLTKYADETITTLGKCGCLLLSGEKEKSNVMTIGWGLIGQLWGKPCFMVAVRPSRYTFKFMEESGEFTVLVSLLTNPAYSDIAETLSGDGPFTVFAPTDAAFGDIDTNGLTEEQIRTVLLYHAATAKVFSSDLVAGQVLPMVAGQNLTVVSVSNDGVVLQDKSNDETNVVIANVHGSNGVIHAVDKVLIPEL